jgi:hypothetical protein
MKIQKLINLFKNIYTSLPPVAERIGNEKRKKLAARISPCF